MVILLVPTLKIVLLLAAVWTVCSAELITVEGYKGGKAEIRCPYREEWRSHQKYLCKGECRVFNKDKVIKTEAGENSTSRGRYSLKDIREESVFIVTITNLTLKDAGRYWCGVDTWGQDNYIKVNLEVSEDWCCENPTEVTGSEEVTGYEELSVSIHYTSVVIIVSGTLVMLLLVLVVSLLVVSLLIVYRGKFNKETADSSAPRVNTDTRINREGCHGDGDSEEIKNRPLQSSSGSETTTIYSTAKLPTSPSDSLNYASVNFHQNPSCLNEARVAFSKVATSSGDYAAVNIGQSPTYSTVIYSTVSQSGEL